MEVKKYDGPVTCSIELVTPEFSQIALRKNDNNRKMNRHRVELYKRDMIEGKWQLNGESIIFYDDGTLKDGQHRLEGIAETGIPQWMVVVRGVPSSNVIADRGQARSSSNILEIAGYPAAVRSTHSVGAVSLLHRIILGKHMLTDLEISSFIDKYGQILAKAYELCRSGSNRPVCKKSPVVAALFCALYSGVSYDVLKNFCTVANTGFCDADTQYSAIVVRNYLLQTETGGTSTLRNNVFYITMLAIEDFVSGTPRRNIYNPNKRSKYFTAVSQGIFNQEN